MTLNEIRQHFKNATPIRGNKFQCSCPVHNDKNPSLTITEKDGKILLYCHAGCNTSDILQAVGLKWADINPNNTKYIKNDYNEYQAVYNYYDNNEQYIYSKTRQIIDGKKIIKHAVFKNGNIISNKKPSNAPFTLYNLKALKWAINEGLSVYYCEGEKDIDTLKGFNLIGATAGSATDWKSEHAKFFKGAKLTILQDNDEIGEKLTTRMLNDLQSYCHSIRVVKPSNKIHGDVTDYIRDGHDKIELIELIEKTPHIYAPWIYSKGERQYINADILAKHIVKNDDYIIIGNCSGKNKTIYKYKNGVYKNISELEIKADIRKYIPNGLLTGSKLVEIYILMLPYIDTVDIDKINNTEKYINFKNGLLNIETWTLEPHNKKIISTVQINGEYRATPEPSKWIKFIDEFCQDESGNIKEDMKKALQEWAGFAISNIKGYKIKKAFILYSPIGNTGKSLFINTITSLIGRSNVANVTFHEMSGSRWTGARAFAKRLLVVGDQRGEEIESSAMFKQLTGGDTIQAEMKGRDGFDYLFTGIVAVACNILPTFKDDKGNHLIERLAFYHCQNPIAENRRNPFLEDEFINEQDGIITWAINGLKRLLNNDLKFTPCQSSKLLEKDYRKGTDTLYNYIISNYDITGNYSDKIKRAKLHDDFKLYCIDEGLKPFSAYKIGTNMESMGIYKARMGDGYYYVGIKPKSVTSKGN